MFPAELPEDQKLLKSVLEPLLEDFLYWFDLSLKALEKDQLSFMTEAEQQTFIARIRQAQAEVGAAKLMFQATDGGAAIDMKVVMPWHQLVSECWGIAQKRRQSQAS
ncbi:MAG: DUF2605 domain-containing protein [Limnothrix sp.]